MADQERVSATSFVDRHVLQAGDFVPKLVRNQSNAYPTAFVTTLLGMLPCTNHGFLFLAIVLNEAIITRSQPMDVWLPAVSSLRVNV